VSYIEFHREQVDDPRVGRAAMLLKIPIPHFLGHWSLFKSWATGEKFRAFTGDISQFTPEKIGEVACYRPAEPMAYLSWTQAIIDSELVIRDPAAPPIQLGEPIGGGATISDWLDTCGEATRKRIERRTKADDVGQGFDSDIGRLLSANGKANTTTPLWRLFMVFKYVKKGKDMEAVRSDNRWNLLNKDMSFPWLKRILDAYDGNLEQAAAVVLKLGNHFAEKGLTFNASTIYKHITDLEDDNLGK